MTTELQTQVASGSLADFGFGSQDIVIPRLLLAQNTSESVSNEQAKLGDILVSMSGERVGGISDPIEVVPIHLFKTWRIYNMSEEFKARGGKLVEVVPFTQANAKWDWEGNASYNGRMIPVKRFPCANAYVLLKRDLEAGSQWPMSLVFKSSSAQAGKQFVSLVYRDEMLKRPLFYRSVLVSSVKQKKETNAWSVFDVKSGNLVDPQYYDACTEWQGKVRNSVVKEDGADEDSNEDTGRRTVVVQSTPEDAF